MPIQHRTHTKNHKDAQVFDVAILAILSFCAPTFEAPTNLCGALFVFVFVLRAIWERNAGQRRSTEWPIIGLVVVLYVAAFTSDYRHEIDLLFNATRWTQIGLVAVLASRLRFKAQHILIILAALFSGTVFSVIESYWEWSVAGVQYPDLRSLRHVNTSVLYLIVIIAIALGAFTVKKWWLSGVAGLAIISALSFLAPSRSLVGVVTYVALFVSFSLAMAYLYRYLRAIYISLGIVLGLALSIWGGIMPYSAPLVEEINYRVNQSDSFFSYREHILKTALEVYDRHILFGSGARSFKRATAPEIVRAEIEAEGRDWEAEKNEFFFTNHGHNLFTNVLINRGLLGIALLLWFLFLWVRFFLPYLPAIRQGKLPDPFAQSLVISSLLLFVGTMVSGLGNTPLHNEHGLVAMLFLGLAISYLSDHFHYPTSRKNFPKKHSFQVLRSKNSRAELKRPKMLLKTSKTA